MGEMRGLSLISVSPREQQIFWAVSRSCLAQVQWNFRSRNFRIHFTLNEFRVLQQKFVNSQISNNKNDAVFEAFVVDESCFCKNFTSSEKPISVPLISFSFRESGKISHLIQDVVEEFANSQREITELGLAKMWRPFSLSGYLCGQQLEPTLLKAGLRLARPPLG